MSRRTLRAQLESPRFENRYEVSLNGGTATWLVHALSPEHAKQRWLELVPTAQGPGARYKVDRSELSVRPATAQPQAAPAAIEAFPGTEEWGATPATATALRDRIKRKGR